MLLTIYEFHTNQCSEGHTLHSTDEFLPILSEVHWPNWVKFGIRDLHIKLFSICKLVRIGADKLCCFIGISEINFNILLTVHLNIFIS
jgi:hypothetical protein